jgi:hypothetical protein
MVASSSAAPTPATPAADASAIEAHASYNLFFSHKTQYLPVTKYIIEMIQKTIENTACFISEDVTKGTDWREAIAKQQTLSNFLVLVFPILKRIGAGACMRQAPLRR